MPSNRTLAALALSLAVFVLGCGHKPTPPELTAHAQAMAVAAGAASSMSATAPPPEVKGVPLTEEVVIGEPRVFENLTIFPVRAKHQEDIGPITTLEEAIAKKTAVVRELQGAEAQQATRGTSVTIENNGDTPLFVLAGLVVKGGHQDRQIGQDFIVGAHTTMAVEAFCVEQGRSTGATNTFGTLKVLANREVRVAAQYAQDQSQVWSKVGTVNSAHKKAPGTSTLVASLGDRELTMKRDAMAEKVDAFLKEGDASNVVGVAYAVSGKVSGVRWFLNNKLFTLHRSMLVNTAIVDAMTAQATRGGQPVQTAPVLASAVRDFVRGVDEAKEEKTRATPGENVNTYKQSDVAYGSKATIEMKPSASSSTSPAGSPKAAPRKVNVSSDYSAK